MAAIQLQDACAALIGAKRSLDDVANQAKDVPRLFGRKEAVESIATSLDTAMMQLDIAGTSLGAIDAHAATSVADAATELKTVAAGLQARSGVKLLTAKPFTEVHRDIDALAGQARMALGQDSWPTAESVDAIAAPIFAKHFSELTVADYERLADLAALPASIRPAGLDEAKLRQAIVVINSNPTPTTNALHHINELRGPVAFRTREAASERLETILRMPESELTAAHFEELDMLQQLPDELRPAAFEKFTTANFASAMDPKASAGNRELALKTASGVRNAAILQDADAATAALREVLSKSYDDMLPADMRALGDLQGSHLGDDIKQGATPTLSRSSLRRMATRLEGDGSFAGFSNQLSKLNMLRAHVLWGDRDASTARLAEIVAKSPERVTRQDIHDFDGLLHLPDTKRPLALRGIQLEANVLAQRAEAIGRGRALGDSASSLKAFTRAKERMEALTSTVEEVR